MNTSHGILMSAEMIRAYQIGMKGQTRRTRGLDEINQSPDEWQFERFVESGKRKRVFVMEREAARFVNKAKTRFVDVRLPYGSAGHTLWFRETWKMWERDEDGRDFLHYRADDAKVDPTWWSEQEWTRPDPIWCKKGVFEKWQPSMFMPKLCCRHRDIDILNVRVERLQDICHIDAIREGCPMDADEAKTPRQWYQDLWDKINGKTLPWRSNPWVWVYEFPEFKS